jgi:hypothetical protein
MGYPRRGKWTRDEMFVSHRVGLLVDSEIGLSTRNGNARVFINGRYLKMTKRSLRHARCPNAQGYALVRSV